MATKTEKLMQELKKNYSLVQSKDIEHKEFKTKSDKEIKTDIKSHHNELTKTLKEISKNKDAIQKSFDEKMEVLVESNNGEKESLVNERKKATRANKSEVKKLESNYEIHKKALEDKLSSAKLTFNDKISDIEDKYTVDVNESNDRRVGNKAQIKSNIEDIIKDVMELESNHETLIAGLEQDYKAQLDELYESIAENTGIAEQKVEDIRESNSAQRVAHVQKSEKDFSSIETKIQREEASFQKKLASAKESFQSKIDRQEKFKVKREEESDLKGVRERTKEIKKLNTEKESQLRIINRNHLKESKKLDLDKMNLTKSQIISLSALDKDHCALIEEKLNDVAILKITTEESVTKLEINYKKTLDEEKVKHNKAYEKLESKKAVMIYDSSKIDIDEDLVSTTTEEEYKRSKSVLSENYDKEVAEHEFKLRELKHKNDFDLEAAGLNNEFRKLELEIKESNTLNKHHSDESSLNETKIISEHAIVYSTQFAKNLEYLKFQNSVAINNVENNNAFLVVEMAEIENRYDIRLNLLRTEYENRILSFKPLKEKMELFYEDEVIIYNELIENLSGAQNQALVELEASAKEEISKKEAARDALPKRGNRKEIKLLNNQIKTMEHDLHSELKEKKHDIEERTSLYAAELKNSKARYENSLESLEQLKSIISNSFEATIMDVEKQKDFEIKDTNERQTTMNNASKEFDGLARKRREVSIDENKAYQSARSDHHDEIIKKLEEEFKDARKTNTANIKAANEKTENLVKVKKQKFESTVKPLHDKLVSTVTSCNSTKEKVNDKAKELTKMAKELAHTRDDEAKKTQKASNEKVRSEIAGREALLSFSKNEIQNEEQYLKKDIDTKIKQQHKIYKDQLSLEIDKISNKLTADISNLMQ